MISLFHALERAKTSPPLLQRERLTTTPTQSNSSSSESVNQHPAVASNRFSLSLQSCNFVSVLFCELCECSLRDHIGACQPQKDSPSHHDIINLPLPSPSSHYTPLPPPPPTIHPTRHHTSSHQPSPNQRRMLILHHHLLQLSQLQRHSSQRLCQMRWILVCGL